MISVINQENKKKENKCTDKELRIKWSLMILKLNFGRPKEQNQCHHIIFQNQENNMLKIKKKFFLYLQLN